MRSQIQFFMDPTDEAEFMVSAASAVDSVEKESERQWQLIVGDCPIQFLRCMRFPEATTSGRIAIATHGFGVQYASAGKAERVFNRFRRDLKKSYENNLSCRNLDIPGSVRTAKDFWVGPELVKRITAGEPITLKQDRYGRVVFERN